MAMLECYIPSMIAFRVLTSVADGFMVVTEEMAPKVMRRLANPTAGDPPIVSGESGGAGMGGQFNFMQDAALAAKMGLDRNARVLVFDTAGATDPELFAKIVGQTPEDVLARPAA